MKIDKNSISPGTEFMHYLSTQIDLYIKFKVHSDPSFQKIEVIFSNPYCPGEGEHKIIDYI